MAPVGGGRPDVYCLLLMSACSLKASGPWTPRIPGCRRFIIDREAPQPPPPPPSHYCTPSTVIDWMLPSPCPARSLPDRSLTLSETPLLSGEVIRVPFVFMLPRRWEEKKKKYKNFVEVKVADHRKRFQLSVPRGPGRISAARLSCSV